jgi:diguanylate cyclase (GGDEF)-like protein
LGLLPRASGNLTIRRIHKLGQIIQLKMRRKPPSISEPDQKERTPAPETALFTRADLPLLPILERAAEGFCLAVPNPWRVAYANPTLLSWVGARLSDCGDRPLAELFREVKTSETQSQLTKILQGELDEAALWSELPTRQGSDLTVRLRIRRIVLPTQSMLGIIAQKPETGSSAESHIGRVDPLTGLPDRSFILDRLDVLLESNRTADRQFSVLFVDMNNFKHVNDKYGHLVGDRVLCEVVRRMMVCVRGGDQIARYGGDEFVVLVARVSSAEEVQPVIDRIHASLQAPFELPDGEVTLSASVGVAMAGPEVRTAEELLAAADQAMYASKRSGG